MHLYILPNLFSNIFSCVNCKLTETPVPLNACILNNRAPHTTNLRPRYYPDFEVGKSPRIRKYPHYPQEVQLMSVISVIDLT